MRSIWLGLTSGVTEVLGHKLRSFLTLFGIVLGAASLVGMLGVVKGLLSGWEKMIYESGGIERIDIGNKSPPESQREIAPISPGRTLNDVRAILAAVPLAKQVTAEVNLNNGRLFFQGRNAWSQPRGVLPASFVMDRITVADGRLIADYDLEMQTQVIILGSGIARSLFVRGLDPMDRVITLNGLPFTVIGVLPEYTSRGGDNDSVSERNYAVFIPLTTAQTLFRTDEKVDVLSVQVEDIRDMGSAQQQINNVLTHTHRGVQDVQLRTREALLQQYEETRNSYFASFGGIAVIGLVVGGIGIMNVILASISERVREIGVRRALGAKRIDILIQILSESMTLAVGGGIVGVVASIGLILVLQHVVVPTNRPTLSPAALLIGIASSAIVGVISGLYPAFRASRLSPVEALRSD